MLAEDVAPNRLERAKVELASLLSMMDDGQQVGLIGFAGKSTVMSPMTTDFGFLRMILRETRPDSVGLGGTKIGGATRKTRSVTVIARCFRSPNKAISPGRGDC